MQIIVIKTAQNTMGASNNDYIHVYNKNKEKKKKKLVAMGCESATG